MVCGTDPFGGRPLGRVPERVQRSRRPT